MVHCLPWFGFVRWDYSLFFAFETEAQVHMWGEHLAGANVPTLLRVLNERMTPVPETSEVPDFYEESLVVSAAGLEQLELTLDTETVRLRESEKELEQLLRELWEVQSRNGTIPGVHTPNDVRG
eukprot:c10426_g1_i2.p2 GENE.c10426_g1_i2~~c10426_g1_i2.p2  ORF type:complete len:124 (+),score=27.57 c10426_g1_i2:460-831(+)